MKGPLFVEGRDLSGLVLVSLGELRDICTTPQEIEFRQEAFVLGMDLLRSKFTLRVMLRFTSYYTMNRVTLAFRLVQESL